MLHQVLRQAPITVLRMTLSLTTRQDASSAMSSAVLLNFLSFLTLFFSLQVLIISSHKQKQSQVWWSSSDLLLVLLDTELSNSSFLSLGIFFKDNFLFLFFLFFFKLILFSFSFIIGLFFTYIILIAFTSLDWYYCLLIALCIKNNILFILIIHQL